MYAILLVCIDGKNFAFLDVLFIDLCLKNIPFLFTLECGFESTPSKQIVGIYYGYLLTVVTVHCKSSFAARPFSEDLNGLVFGEKGWNIIPKIDKTVYSLIYYSRHIQLAKYLIYIRFVESHIKISNKTTCDFRWTNIELSATVTWLPSIISISNIDELWT